MDKELENQEQHLQAEAIDEIVVQIISQPKRKYTQAELDEARQNLALMNDRVFLAHFIDNKNNHVITGLADAARKIHALPPIPQVQNTAVQNISLFDVLGRGMIGDLLGWGEAINIALEVQKGKQDGYAVRGTLTSSNAMRTGFNMGDDFTEAPDVIGINILGFRLPQLAHRKEFISRIIRSEYDSKVPFLDDKYSDYYIELPKMDDMKKEDLPEEYHDLWDLCCIFRAKIKDMEEVIRMQAVKNPIALDLASGVRKTVAQNDVVNDTLNRAGELLQLQNYFRRREQQATQNAEERMIVMAIQSNAPTEVISTMQKGAGITDTRLAELRKQAQIK
ncbi:MAG: Rpn family recombination-promoting nuclease/putative transposase [Defluviitaleaceae bacterium]|nr:Rpn family recombination-promoting nuclease/putative transposase [Defluviitaleaceae bacterium]MCL2239885.1 Rpn family recombination-promoting nuclease/putative transposase [Defluviitaleaceae bacterium]